MSRKVKPDEYVRSLRRLGLVRTEDCTRALLEDVFRNVDLAGVRVLDIGGGKGLYSFYAATKGAREVVCLEPEAAGSSNRVTSKFDRIRAEFPDLPVRLDRRPVQEYRDEDGFDVILMNASINHIDEDACIRLADDARARETFTRVFSHIATLAKPGARLIVVDCTRHNLFPALGLKNPLIPAIEWHKHQAPELWASLLREAGFRDPRISWQPLYRLGWLGRLLLANKAAAYFLKGVFRLQMQRA